MRGIVPLYGEYDDSGPCSHTDASLTNGETGAGILLAA
jgi:hypothetical protein